MKYNVGDVFYCFDRGGTMIERVSILRINKHSYAMNNFVRTRDEGDAITDPYGRYYLKATPQLDEEWVKLSLIRTMTRFVENFNTSTKDFFKATDAVLKNPNALALTEDVVDDFTNAVEDLRSEVQHLRDQNFSAAKAYEIADYYKDLLLELMNLCGDDLYAKNPGKWSEIEKLFLKGTIL